MAQTNLFNIPPGAPFLQTFVEALLAGRLIPGVDGDDPLNLASLTIYTPTRRAARALASEFAERLRPRSALLPRIVPLGQSEDIETSLAFDEEELEESTDGELPPSIDEFERRLALSSLILAWSRAVQVALLPLDGATLGGPRETLLIAATPAQAWALARDLSALIDEMIIEEAPWSALDHVAPEEFDRYWKITLDFLKIAADHWPSLLAERGKIDTARRRAALIERQMKQIEAGRGGPVIAIGSTGTNRFTAKLLDAIARSSRGAVVLPGLDQELDDETWKLIGSRHAETGAAGHPQAALKRLLERLSANRRDVQRLGWIPEERACRNAFVREALLPADATVRWPMYPRDDLHRALAGVTLIEANDEREEALAIAVRLREAVETPGTTAALITPDRGIAARVRAELARWSIEIEDSAGEPLAARPAGAFAQLVLSAAEGADFSIELAALLAHPHCLLGFERDQAYRLARLAEIALIRSDAALAPSLDEALKIARERASGRHAHPTLRNADESLWEGLRQLLVRLHRALSALRSLRAGAFLAEWIAAHREAIEAIGREQDFGEDATALNDLFARLLEAARDAPIKFELRDYSEFFASVAREIAVRVEGRGHPRVRILGLLEARLLSVDLALLAGLDEAIWPPAAATDPFLNRPMRAALGLSAPERRIGQTAHDLSQAMGAPQVVLSRAFKRSGSPTTPSRFLQRMQALAGPPAWEACRSRGLRWLHLAGLLDETGAPKPIRAPAPRPALRLRPQRLSVTRLETLRRDPYSVYAESILRLTPLPPLEAAEAARTAGVEIHDVLAEFVRAHRSGPLPPDAATEALRAAGVRFEALLEDVEWRAFHWPRFQKAIDAFVGWEANRRDEISDIYVEERGELKLTLADGSPFTLVAIADRLEQRVDGSWVVVDYKSGRAPSVREVGCGFAPQLTLEAAMLARGAFPCAAQGSRVARTVYVRLAGAEPISERDAGDPKEPLETLVSNHFEGAVSLLSQFRLESTPYVSRPYPQFANRFGVYDHLARVKEWSSPAVEGEESA